MIDDGKGQFEIPICQIADFLVLKDIVINREEAKTLIRKSLPENKHSEVVQYEQFSKIFCKGIFKEALLAVTEQLDAPSKGDNTSSLSLPVQVNQYQRKMMVDGLLSTSGDQGQSILRALAKLKEVVKGPTGKA